MYIEIQNICRVLDTKMYKLSHTICTFSRSKIIVINIVFSTTFIHVNQHFFPHVYRFSFSFPDDWNLLFSLPFQTVQTWRILTALLVFVQVFTYLGPWMGFDLRELEFCVVWIHLSDLFPSWGSQHLKIDVRGVWTVFCRHTGHRSVIDDDYSGSIWWYQYINKKVEHTHQHKPC